jgi:RNA polymerase sigma factor (sigma-70 family)
MNRSEQFETAEFSLADLRRGDEQAWRGFFRRYDGLIRSVVSWPKWRFDPHAQEDVVQTIRAAVVQSIGNLQREGSLPGFLRRICAHRCIDALRRKLREQERLLPLGRWDEDGDWTEVDCAADEAYDPTRAVLVMERAQALRAAMERIDETCRAAIREFYTEGRSYREIADRQGIAINTVGSRLSRCLERLRTVLCRAGVSEAGS